MGIDKVYETIAMSTTQKSGLARLILCRFHGLDISDPLSSQTLTERVVKRFCGELKQLH